MIKRIKRFMINELGNEIEFEVTADLTSVVIHAIGPTSEVHHTWTRYEAIELRRMLDSVLSDEPESTDHRPF